jgi:tRNA(Arg) A34 adenosine deaminase TadA
MSHKEVYLRAPSDWRVAARMMSRMQGNPEFMRQAIALATENVTSGSGGPFGAVIVRNGMVVATGVNQVTATIDPTAHAEVVAIRKACAVLGRFSLEGCQMYTSCEPCPMCLAAIYWSRMDEIFYGNTAADAAAAGFDDAFLYEEIKKPVGGRTIPAERMLSDEAQENFAAWRRFAARVHY